MFTGLVAFQAAAAPAAAARGPDPFGSAMLYLLENPNTLISLATLAVAVATLIVVIVRTGRPPRQ